MKNQRLQLDCLLCLGYIAYERKQWDIAKDAFNTGYHAARKLDEVDIAQECLCNVGIAQGTEDQLFQKVAEHATTIHGFESGGDEEEEEDEEDVLD